MKALAAVTVCAMALLAEYRISADEMGWHGTIQQDHDQKTVMNSHLLLNDQ